MALRREAAARLAADPERGPGWFSLPLPVGAAGQWCRLTVTIRSADPWWVKLLAEDHKRDQVVREAFLGPKQGSGLAGTRALLLHVPQFADTLRLNVITRGEAGAPEATLQVLGRKSAALRLLAGGWPKLGACLRGNPAGLAGRIRAELGQAPARAGEPPPYEVWQHFYDAWGTVERDALMARIATRKLPLIEVLLTGDTPVTQADVLAGQWLQPARATTAGPDAVFRRLDGAWLIVVDASERLAPHALACFAYAISRTSAAYGFYADVDMDDAGRRHAPLLKPRADPWLLDSGLLSRGACAFHPDSVVPSGSASANDLRLAMARSMSPQTFVHIPFILTHVRAAPAARPAACTPPADAAPMVSIIIPSACRGGHVLRCLRQLLAMTASVCPFEILLAVSSIDQKDRRQAAILREVAKLPRVRVIDLDMPVFNYAAVNNAAARQANGALLLLLNDDVVPIRAGWLQRMVAFTARVAGQGADIVGARLLYGNGRVQHGGVIMGLASLCEHAFRLTARGDAGPHGIALLDRQVSAVTAACMLVRRDLWEQLGGMDEDFAIALNDVDFCLRAAQLGARTVFAAGVEMYHYESLSLGRHYEGARSGLEALEVRRLRERWQSVIADDPFYNLQASTEPGREFQPAFPPRLTPLSWMAAEDAAQR